MSKDVEAPNLWEESSGPGPLFRNDTVPLTEGHPTYQWIQKALNAAYDWIC